MRLFHTVMWPWHIAWGRLRAEPVLTASLLLAWLTFVALLAAIPMYADAAGQFVLAQELAYGGARKPPYTFYFHYVGVPGEAVGRHSYDALRPYLAEQVQGELGIPRQVAMHYVTSDRFQVYLSEGDYTTPAPPLYARLGFIEGLEERIELVEGRFPEPAAPGASTLDVLVSQSLADQVGLHIGEELILFRSVLAPSPARESLGMMPGGKRTAGVGSASGAAYGVSMGTGQGVQLTVRVAGIWRAESPESEFWYIPPSAFDRALLLPEETYLALAESGSVPRLLHNIGFYQVYDGSSIRAEDVPGFLGRVRRVETRGQMLLPGISLELTPVSALLRYQRSASSQTLQLFGFLVPFSGLVIYFIVTVAGHVVERQRLEIALLKSRGASSEQVFGIYLLQAGLMGAVALAAGPLLGRLVAQGIGVTYSFLHFSGRTLTVAVTRTSILYALVGVLLAGLATVLPALQASRMTIVGAKQEASRPADRPFWRRNGLDIALLAVALYGYYLLQGQGRIAILRPGVGQSPLSNPLLFLAPALFILAAALLVLRLFPLLPAALSRVAAWLRGAATLLAFRNLSRSGHGYIGLLLLLTLGTSLAAFTASAARTIDLNTASQIRYRVGADVALKEGAGIALSEEEIEQAISTGEASTEGSAHGWAILPVEHHLKARSVRAATRVRRLPARVGLPGGLIEGSFFGIDRDTFPQVAYFRPDFAPHSLGRLMNLLAQEPSGVLVGRSVLARTRLNVGDPLPLIGLNRLRSETVTLKIVGVIDYFPTAYPQEGEVFIGNLDYLSQVIGGEGPHDVWLSLRDDTPTEVLIGDLQRVGLRPVSWQDSRDLIRQAQIKPQRTGLFGFFSVGFLITVGICMLAQVVYALVSFRRRFIQFGMLRALGLSQGELALSLSCELGLIVVLGIGAGIALGLITSHLFIPFLQIGYRPADLVPPFEVLVAWEETVRAALALVSTSIVTNALVVLFLARMRVPDALKLGESLA